MTHRVTRSVITILSVLLIAGCSTHQVVKKPVGPAKLGLAQQPQSVHEVKPFSEYSDGMHELENEDILTADEFPRPKSIEPQVNFWRNVYANWSRSQVVIHDNVHMNLVYEVFFLPGDTVEGYTPLQKDFIQEKFNYWRERLRSLEERTAMGASLNSEDQQLAERIVQGSKDAGGIQGASQRLRYQRGLRERFQRGLEISGLYDRQFRTIFRSAGLPEDLAYLPHVESSFQANAHSSAGALGIWQFTAGAAKRFMNGDDSVSARLNPIASAQGAARYLSFAYQKLGSWPLAVTSYNHGIGGMGRAKERFGTNFSRIVKHYDHPLFGFASRNYYAEFLAARDIAKDPQQFFPEGVRYETRPRLMSAELNSDEDLSSQSKRDYSGAAQVSKWQSSKKLGVVQAKSRLGVQKTSRHISVPGARKGKILPSIAEKPAYRLAAKGRPEVKSAATHKPSPPQQIARNLPRPVSVEKRKDRQLADNRSKPVKVAQKDR